MKPRLKTILLSLLCVGLIFGSLFIFKKPKSAAGSSYYESLKIAGTSLNGNSIWGGGETFETIVSSGGLDNWAAFYSATNKSSGGLDASGALSINGVPYQLQWTGASDYTGNDTIRLYQGHESATISLNTIGAYEKLYVLGTAGGPGEGNYANFAVVVHYTDGTEDETDYRLYDWYDATAVSGVYKWPGTARRVLQASTTTSGSGKNKTTTTTYNYEGSTSGAPYLQSATINVNPKKLVSSVDLVLTGRNGNSSTEGIFCGIYAITGMVNISAPDPVETIRVSNVAETTADISWDAVPRATSYRLDIALDPDFKNIVPGFNNLLVNNTSLTATGLTGNTLYYTRVRAENNEGQSISSNVVNFTTLPETTPPTVSIVANPGLIQIKDDATIIGIDASGVKQLDESLDGGETWTKLVDGDRAEREIRENGTYCYRAIDNYNNISEATCVTYSNLDTSKPVVRVNTNGYTEGEWTKDSVTLTVESVTLNVGETKYYYSEDGATWLPYSGAVVVNEETGLDGKTYYFKAISAAGVESDVVETLVRRDITAPAGEINSSANGWNEFLNTVTFGLFFNETKNFEVEATDDLSGLDHIEYLVSSAAFDSKESALSAEGWETTTGPVAINPEGDFILYFKLIDRAGNVAVINTDGIALDTTKALIQGYVDAGHTYPLEDGETYYLTQKLLVSDNRALGEVKVNGVATTETLINLSPNATYHVVATDRAGNVSEITIHTAGLSSLDLGLNEDNFKTSDKPTLEEAGQKLDEILEKEGDHAVDEEKAIIEDLVSGYETLVERIDALEAEIKDEHDRGDATPDLEHITSADYDTIKEIIDDIKTTIEQDSTHLTINETNALLVEKRELEDKLRRLDEVQDDLNALDGLSRTDVDVIKTEDKSELEDLKEMAESLLESENLTEVERQDVEAAVKKLNDLLDRINDAEAAKETENIKDIDGKLPTGYTVEDKTDLEEARADLESALENYVNNYTDEEKQTIEDELAAIDRALEDIENKIWEEIRRTTFPTLSVVSETEKWVSSDVAGVSATDAYDLDRLEVSNDGGETWTLITNLDSGVYTVVENGTYLFRATNSFGNSDVKTVVYHNIDPVTPAVEVDAHGYRLGSWTNHPVTLSASNVAGNISPVTLFYREQSTVDGNDWLPYLASKIVTEDTDSRVFEFKAVSAAGLESEVVSAEVKKDSVVPTGEVSTGENQTNVVLNAITFGLLFNETKVYDMSASDDRSGINTVEYLASDSELNAETLKSSQDWKTTSGSVSLDPNKSANLYFRLTDRAGNVSIVSESGVVFDLPGLSSLDVEVVSKDAGFSSLVTGSGEITLFDGLEHANKNNLETLENVKTDLTNFLDTHDDNQIVKDFLTDYETAIEEINDTETKIVIIRDSYATVPDLDHVTSADEAKIDALISAILAVETENGNRLTPEEKHELDETLDDLRGKREHIEDTKAELEAVDAGVNSFTLETVTKDDLETLEHLESRIETLLESLNVTNEEKEHLGELLETISELKNRIAEAEKAIEEAKQNDHAGNITPGNVTPDDQTVLEDALNGYTGALGVFDSNLALSDLFDVNGRVSILGSALDVLDQVAEFENLVSRLPNPEEVNYSSRLLIKATEGLYNVLSDYGRSLVGPSLMTKYYAVLDAYRAYLEGSPILYAFETLDVFWWGLTTFLIVGAFIIIVRRTRERYVESTEDTDNF
ncbi:Ig-like domain repeat protein [Candidatus Saccharibacteria bacterium]|nr:Ig-like domain repeat protein [Candidatus Saccharibacteria bacterium]